MTRKAMSEGEVNHKLRHRLEDCTEALLQGMQATLHDSPDPEVGFPLIVVSELPPTVWATNVLWPVVALCMPLQKL